MDKQPLVFIYGSEEKYIDITNKVNTSYIFDGHIVIPADDNVRAGLFTDPCFGVVKTITVKGLSDQVQIFDHKTDIVIDTQNNKLITDLNTLRKFVTRPLDEPHRKVRSLHKYLKFMGGSLEHEFPEQCMIAKFLKGDEKVLEIGGNYGRASLIIASILNDSQNHVVLESSPEIAEKLTLNRDANNFKFHVENSALSAKKLIQKGWNTIQSDTPIEGYIDVPIISYVDLVKKYKIMFDTLVLDCEGAFYYIAQDFPEIFEHLKTIIIENDYKTREQKTNIDSILRNNGLRPVYCKSGGADAQHMKFPCIDNFYEVWQKTSNQPTTLDKFGGKFMDSYPTVLFFRYDAYSSIDMLFEEAEKAKLHCSIQIVNSAEKLMALHDPNYHVLVTYGDDEQRYNRDVNAVLPERMFARWLHLNTIQSIDNFVHSVNYCYMNALIKNRTQTRPIFSIFTTCFNSYDKIIRAYNSIIRQTLKDWEWVIMDDSPDDQHFNYLRTKFAQEKRVRLYRRSCNSGSIGNVKNEAVSLCRGKYVLEMDHDDEILPEVLADATRAFNDDPELGFVYMDFINVYEDQRNFWYSDFICKGYGGYYRQKYNGRWVEVYMTPNINNITLSHIVGVPNHPRIWRKSTLLDLGNYSEFLPICDDQELIMRTALSTKTAKIPKLGYVQYMNNNSSNFSLIRNKEINRLGPKFLVPQFYKMYEIHEKMKSLNAYEDEKYIINASPVWKREDYTHVYCNNRIQYNYDTQYCIIGLDAFNENIEALKEAYKNPRNDFILLDTNVSKGELCKILDNANFSNMKCYAMPNTSPLEFQRYFDILYKSCEKTVIFSSGQS